MRSKPDKDTEGLHYPLSVGMVNQLNEVMDYPSARYILQLSRGTVIGILDRVRNMILDWAIRMEQHGIVGEGISFSSKEREQASRAMTHITIGSIGNMAGHIGAANEGDIRATQTANEARVFQDLAKALRQGVEDAKQRERLIAAVDRMSAARSDKGVFAVEYAEFIAHAANHMQVVAPFLPALLPFLSG